MRMTALVLLHLTRTGTAPHADVLYTAAKACLLMSFEMRKGDKDIGIHHGTADVSFLAVLTIGNWNDYVVSSSKSVSDDYLASGSNRVKTVDISAVQVFERMLTASGIKRVAVGKERHAAQFFNDIGNSLGIIGP